MKTWAAVDKLIAEWKTEGISNPSFIVRLANAVIGWAYVFGAAGAKCTPANRRAYYNSKKKETIKTKCKNFDGTGNCSGCKWYPGGVTLFYDCQGFLKWLFKQIGITLKGAGATSMYNDASNWEQRGPISEMPRDRVCCVFRYDSKTGKFEHALLYDGEGHYIHDNGEVRKVDISKYSATHYGIPKGFYEGQIPPQPVPPEPVPPQGKAIVTGRNVALRQGPSTGTAVYMRLPTGTEVDLATVSGWTYVKYRDAYGFMMNEFISIHDNSVTVTGTRVALRQGPSTSARITTRINTGTEVPRASIPDGWAYVRYGNKEGYMMKQYIKEG